MIPLKKEERFTYTDYYSWDDDQRWELIEGVPYLMAAPTWVHQLICNRINLKIGQYLEGKQCIVLCSPIDVRLNADTYDDTVVQPDIIVVCDKSKLDDGGSIVGAPDMIVEILSPTSHSRDKLIKFNQYLRAGVREYWIVDPESKMITVHILHSERYVTSAYGETDTVPVHVLEGCEIDLGEVFVE